ncbi:MAG: inorganic pyrophosphatase [Bacteroidales bacterium]|jgi:inorganic pyrophosphatase|nr:inorganic pyrophosphatase [Bacteroidales bacterium]
MKSAYNKECCRFRAHPWHGIEIGDRAPEVVMTYVEMVPTDTVKYEMDKASGYLRLDRPQRYSNVVPALYGFIPRTLTGVRVAELSMERTGISGIRGDGDAMDICILTEKDISHGDILVRARPIGGFRMIDGNEADDKIIAVLESDAVYGEYNDIADCPQIAIERLKHYFLTYKDLPGEKRSVTIPEVYDRNEALEVIRRSMEDYKNDFPQL